jgi:hypothetical protein
MKRVVSISLGSASRDSCADIELLGQSIRIERMGTDGNMEQAAQLFRELDGRVDAFGLGGTDLALQVGERRYPLHSIKRMIRHVHRTPMVDGSGLKNTLEARLASHLDLVASPPVDPRRALITSAVDRWGMATAFSSAGYACIFGDLMFGLGLPIPLRSLQAVRRVATLLLPLATRLPFNWLYPVGEQQEARQPRWQGYYQWATVIAGDCHYIRRHMPDQLAGKIIVTNTTTAADVDLFQRAGASLLLTSTPVIAGRSYGTNVMEAALVAAADKRRPLSLTELAELTDQLDLKPSCRRLN